MEGAGGMRLPKVKKRRYYDVKAFGRTYKESDNDFIKNNLTACIWFLEHRDEINAKLKVGT
jgi:hypothetical protein